MDNNQENRLAGFNKALEKNRSDWEQSFKNAKFKKFRLKFTRFRTTDPNN